MSSVKEIVRGVFNDVARGVRDDMRRDHQARLDESFSDGFNEATNICLGILSENIDSISSRNKAGRQPSAQDRDLLLMLHQIERETKSRLQDFRENGYNGMK